MSEDPAPTPARSEPADDLLLTVVCATPEETARLAEDVAMILAPGDCLCLDGDLGAGKSTFARAAIRALADDATLEVPSPTFTLVQSYPLPRFEVAHLDLYRLEEPEELDELGLDEALERGAALVEWPERGAGRLPADALTVRFSADDGPDSRRLVFHGSQAFWIARLARTRAIRALLEAAGFATATRRYLQGDASPRAYETIRHAARRAILMNAPVLDLPPSDAGDTESYAEKVHLARDLVPVVAVGAALLAAGFCAPETFAADCPAGLLLQEDLGQGSFLDDGAPVAERYLAAVDLLVDLQARRIGPVLEVPASCGGGIYRVPAFDPRAMLAEAELFLDWYLPQVDAAPDAVARVAFRRLWQPLLEAVGEAEPVLVLRDYHSPNLIWREERSGHDRLGLVDYQDAVMGSPAYDLASLAMDARVDVPRDLEARLVARYLERCRAVDPAVDVARFQRDYAIMAAQRASKVLGVFVRLARRDGKPAYLTHLPRVHDYLMRALAHPALDDLRVWLDAAGALAPPAARDGKEHGT
ncbi:tRNA (adenosine(37)-N6)-threonylcarbamoyltransferase complex ATPase subunit type 1 TsaE [Stappia sp.]|uniref:tRNA (adenosine(37)-N6)-threonylcarbamoyltransferase complex ATPase subunit type 1 TsaE n=1 Tax=Stappia sp. TaxID=1870903 RepID=UPI0032D9708C